MSFLADTNILLRIAQQNHPHHEAALGGLERLLAESIPVYFTLQNVAEFWNLATRPVAHNGPGYPIDFAVQEIKKIETLLTLLPDSRETYAEWKRLVVKYQVFGGKVHDARLVATMLVHGVKQLLTFDTGDFFATPLKLKSSIRKASSFERS